MSTQVFWQIVPNSWCSNTETSGTIAFFLCESLTEFYIIGWSQHCTTLDRSNWTTDACVNYIPPYCVFFVFFCFLLFVRLQISQRQKKIGSWNFCMCVRLLSGEVFSHFVELWLAESHGGGITSGMYAATNWMQGAAPGETQWGFGIGCLARWGSRNWGRRHCLKMICNDFLVAKVNCLTSVSNIIKSIWILKKIKK